MIDAPSEDAVELYRVALRAIALAGIYPKADVGYALARLKQEQARETRGDNDWKAFEHMCDALLAAAMNEEMAFHEDPRRADSRAVPQAAPGAEAWRKRGRRREPVDLNPYDVPEDQWVQCDCCGRVRPCTRGVVCGLEAVACEECSQ